MKRILIIDDDHASRDIALKVLTKEGYSVLSVSGGREGLEMVQKHKFDLIICDLMMPEIDGFEVIETIRKSMQTPILAYSALQEMKYIDRAKALGATHYVTKPVSVSTLVSEVRKIIDA